MSGDEGLWALKLDPPDGKSNTWNRSALNVLKIADEGKCSAGTSPLEWR
jgi:hypothetical protein